MDRLTQTLIITACIVGIIVGGVWLSKNVSYGCIDLGFIKHCGATVVR